MEHVLSFVIIVIHALWDHIYLIIHAKIVKQGVLNAHLYQIAKDVYKDIKFIKINVDK